MMLPNALVVGPMKSGTTWIHDYFQSRGDVTLPRDVKETFFFDRHFSRGVEWYAQRFTSNRPGPTSSLIAEVAPSLFHDAKAPTRVASVLGDVPIVVTLRDPVNRAWSHYNHMRRYGYTNSGLEEAVETHPEIVLASCYERNLSRWREALPQSRILELQMEQLETDPQSYCDKLCDFLDISSVDVSTLGLAPSNASAEPPSFYLAKIGRRTAHALRDSGFYNVVNAAKAMGLKALFFGNPNRPARSSRPSEQETAWLKNEIGRLDLPTGGSGCQD